MGGFYFYSLILECALLYMINCQNSAEQVYSLLSQRLSFENSLLRNELQELKAVVRKQDDKIAAIMSSPAFRTPDIAEDKDGNHRNLQKQITILHHAFQSEKELVKGLKSIISELESKLKQELLTGIDSSISEIESKLVKKLVTEIESSASELESKLVKEIAEIKSSTSELESKFEKEIAEITSSASELESKLERQKVAFSAELSTTTSELPVHSTIIFDKILHQDGNGYNASDGVFTSPVTGVYMFSVVLHTWHEKDSVETLAALLVVDSQFKAYIVSESHHTWHNDQASNLIILRVHQGQRVWVRTYDKDAKVYRSFSTFSGALLYN